MSLHVEVLQLFQSLPLGPGVLRGSPPLSQWPVAPGLSYLLKIFFSLRRVSVLISYSLSIRPVARLSLQSLVLLVPILP